MRNKESDWIILSRLGDVILENTKGCIVEIGIGQSSKILNRLARAFKKSYYACDIWDKRYHWAINIYRLGHSLCFEQEAVCFS